MHPSDVNPYTESRKSPEARSGGIVDAIALEDAGKYLISEVTDVFALTDGRCKLDVRVDDAAEAPASRLKSILPANPKPYIDLDLVSLPETFVVVFVSWKLSVKKKPLQSRARGNRIVADDRQVITGN